MGAVTIDLQKDDVRLRQFVSIRATFPEIPSGSHTVRAFQRSADI